MNLNIRERNVEGDDMEIIKFVPCSCGAEVLQVVYDEEDNLYYLCIYEIKRPRTLWHRLRLIWKILRTGEPYEDQIVLDKEGAKELRTSLQHLKVK